MKGKVGIQKRGQVWLSSVAKGEGRWRAETVGLRRNEIKHLSEGGGKKRQNIQEAQRPEKGCALRANLPRQKRIKTFIPPGGEDAAITLIKKGRGYQLEVSKRTTWGKGERRANRRTSRSEIQTEQWKRGESGEGIVEKRQQTGRKRENQLRYRGIPEVKQGAPPGEPRPRVRQEMRRKKKGTKTKHQQRKRSSNLLGRGPESLTHQKPYRTTAKDTSKGEFLEHTSRGLLRQYPERKH